MLFEQNIASNVTRNQDPKHIEHNHCMPTEAPACPTRFDAFWRNLTCFDAFLRVLISFDTFWRFWMRTRFRHIGTYWDVLGGIGTSLLTPTHTWTHPHTPSHTHAHNTSYSYSREPIEPFRTLVNSRINYFHKMSFGERRRTMKDLDSPQRFEANNNNM